MEQPLDDRIPTRTNGTKTAPTNGAIPDDTVSLGALFSDLSADLSTLVRKEIDLAKAETMEKATAAGRNIAMIAAGGLVAYAGVITLIIALAIALGSWMPYWLSALIVGAIVLIVGVVLMQSGRSALQQMSMAPKKTIATMKDNSEWVKEQVQ